MKKINELTYYHEVLDNGLNVYILPNNYCNNNIAYFTTKFGGMHVKFKALGNNETKEYPEGIAHFLEHSMFGYKKVKVMEYLQKYNAENNAYTSLYNTTYYFSSPTNFKNNLNLLLDFVQGLELTEEEVEKEKGIIISEINMNMKSFYYEYDIKSNHALYGDDPLSKNVIGSKESVLSITKEQLEDCYNTFYHPKNMYLTITSPMNKDDIMKIIKENQSKKTFINNNGIAKITTNNNKDIIKKEDTVKWDFKDNIVSINYKVDLPKYEDKYKLQAYLDVYVNLCLINSKLDEKVRKNKISNYNISTYQCYEDDHFIVSSDLITNNKKKYINLINNHIKKFKTTKKEFDIIVNSLAFAMINIEENTGGLTYFINKTILENDNIPDNVINIYQTLNYEEFLEIIKYLDFSKYNVITIGDEKNDCSYRG